LGVSQEAFLFCVIVQKEKSRIDTRTPSFSFNFRINDNAALGRSTSKPGIESEELESNPYQVEGLTGPNEEEFKAIRVAAGDSVSLAVSEQGEVKAWGSFRVRLIPSPSLPSLRANMSE